MYLYQLDGNAWTELKQVLPLSFSSISFSFIVELHILFAFEAEKNFQPQKHLLYLKVCKCAETGKRTSELLWKEWTLGPHNYVFLKLHTAVIANSGKTDLSIIFAKEREICCEKPYP